MNLQLGWGPWEDSASLFQLALPELSEGWELESCEGLSPHRAGDNGDY